MSFRIYDRYCKGHATKSSHWKSSSRFKLACCGLYFFLLLVFVYAYKWTSTQELWHSLINGTQQQANEFRSEQTIIKENSYTQTNMKKKKKKTQIKAKKGSQAAAQKRTAARDPKENKFIISTPNSERKCHFLFILIFLSDTLFGFTFSFRFPQPTWPAMRFSQIFPIFHFVWRSSNHFMVPLESFIIFYFHRRVVVNLRLMLLLFESVRLFRRRLRSIWHIELFV